MSRPLLYPVDITLQHVFSGHQRIAQCLAQYYGEGPLVPENTITTTNLRPISSREVVVSLAKAPPNSANGADDVNISILQCLQRAHPRSLADIYTGILETGVHPQQWKRAIIVPIPKANKPCYTVPKSWRSIHLLSVVSKTLERIVLARLQQSERNSTSTSPLGPTQFGSREKRGTADAMQALSM